MADLSTLLAKEASTEIEAILSEANERAAQITEAARSEAESIVADRERRAKSQREASLVRARSAAQLEASAIRLRAQHEGVRGVFDDVRRRLDELVADKSRYPAVFEKLLEQAVAAIKLRQSAELDALTGSLNRRSIDQWLARCFLEAERDGQPLSVLFVDLDRFKGINDRYGHAAGDQCLRAVAGTLSGALDEGDVFGRYGGEEFIAILPGRSGAAARQVGERLRAAVERLAVDWEGQSIKLTVSVGVATRRDGERTPAATIERADKALYASKRAGRNCVHVAPAVFT